MKRDHLYLEVPMITIKPLEEQNISKFVDTHINCWEETYYGLFEEEVIESRRAKKRARENHIKERLTKNKNYFYYCLMDDFEIVGVLIFSILDDKGLLDALYIKKEYQKKGYGHRMLFLVKTILKEKDIEEYYLYVFKANRAKLFFEKEGALFTKEEEISIHGKDYKELEYIMKVGD